MNVILIFGLCILGVCCHEFCHAIVAYWGGDHTVKDKGYLTFNPLRYADPVTSLLFPLIFLVMGGIPLPGGAVYIERSLLKNETWGSWVSLAGPVGSLLFGILLATPFFLGFSAQFPVQIQEALAFVIVIMMASVVLNLLPVPGLDGFGVIRPYLPYSIQESVSRLGNMAFLLILIVIMSEPVGHFIFKVTYQMCSVLNVPPDMAYEGGQAFRRAIGMR